MPSSSSGESIHVSRAESCFCFEVLLLLLQITPNKQSAINNTKENDTQTAYFPFFRFPLSHRQEVFCFFIFILSINYQNFFFIVGFLCYSFNLLISLLWKKQYSHKHSAYKKEINKIATMPIHTQFRTLQLVLLLGLALTTSAQLEEIIPVSVAHGLLPWSAAFVTAKDPCHLAIHTRISSAFTTATCLRHFHFWAVATGTQVFAWKSGDREKRLIAH